MKTLTFTLTEENRKLSNTMFPLAWDVAVKTIALTRFKAGTASITPITLGKAKRFYINLKW